MDQLKMCSSVKLPNIGTDITPQFIIDYIELIDISIEVTAIVNKPISFCITSAQIFAHNVTGLQLLSLLSVYEEML